MDTEHHRPTCTGPDVTTRTTSTGTRRAHCRACGKYWKVIGGTVTTSHTPAPITAPTVTAPTVTTTAARLVCRDHHDQAVSATGKGCVMCSQAVREHAKAKAAKRAKARLKAAGSRS